MARKVAVIGAGCSGLTGIKSCLEEGLEPVCFERQGDIGGLWNYTEKSVDGRGAVYRSCVINTSKEMMAFSDFPVPEHFPNFMPHEYVIEYFRSYMDRFDLKKHIRFNTSVEMIRKACDYEKTGRWEVETVTSEGGERRREIFDGVLVCTGHHCHPNIPHFPRLEKFQGVQMHSHDYRTPGVFEGKNVLIIGMGNSAVDIAVDAARAAKQVFLSTRQGAWIVSRMGPYGIPADVLANSRFMFSFPNTWLQWIVEKIANFRFDHEMYGVKPEHGALEAHPTINDELPYEIMKGRVKVVNNVDHFGKDGVTFTNGTSAQIDVVVMATGYNYSYPFLDEGVIRLEKNETDLYKYTFPPSLPQGTLAIVGLVQAIGAVMPISEMQARWFSQIVSGRVKLPSKEVMDEQISQKRKWLKERYIPSQRHTLETFWIEFMDDLAAEIGCKPDLTALFFKDPVLALRCFFGPCLPSQYRLQGRGKWDDAPHVIRKTFTNIARPTQTRTMNTKKGSTEEVNFVWIVLVFLGIIYFLLFYLPLALPSLF